MELKDLAKWRSLRIATAASGGLAFAADFLRPAFDWVHLIAAAALASTVVSAVALYWLQPARPSARRGTARLLLASIVSLTVFAGVSVIHAAIGEGESASARLLVPIAALQEAILPAQQDLRRVVSDVGAIRASEERQEDALSQLDETLNAQLATEALDRAVQSKSDAMQGQDVAAQWLIAAGYSFRRGEYSGLALTGADLTDGDFSGADLRGANLDEATIANAAFVDADLAFASLRNANGNHVALKRSRLPYADLSGSDLPSADFSQSNMFGTSLAGARLDGANFRGAALVGVDLRRADLRNADMTDAVILGSMLDGAMLEGTTFSNTDVTGTVGIDLSNIDGTPGLCVRVGGTDLGAQIFERLSSNDSDTGYRIRQIYRFAPQVFIPEIGHLFNEECVRVPPERIAQNPSPIYENQPYANGTRIVLPTELLERANRRTRFENRVFEHLELLQGTIVSEDFVRSAPDRFSSVVRSIDARTETLSAPEIDCFDRDTAALGSL